MFACVFFVGCILGYCVYEDVLSYRIKQTLHRYRGRDAELIIQGDVVMLRTITSKPHRISEISTKRSLYGVLQEILKRPVPTKRNGSG